MAFNIGNEFQLYMTHVEGEGPYLKMFGQADKQGALLIESLIMSSRENLESGVGSVQPSALRCGLLCIAKYHDDAFYRAKITSLNNIASGCISVYFIDYGNSDTVPAGSIRLLNQYPEILQTLPSQATDYLLSCIIHPKGVWEDVIVTEIRNLIYYQEIACIVELHIYNKYFVKMQFKNYDLTDYLSSRNYGLKVTLQDQQFLLQKMLSGTKSIQAPRHPFPTQSKSPLVPMPKNDIPQVELFEAGSENTSQAFRLYMAQNSPYCDNYPRNVPKEPTASGRNKLRSVVPPRPLNRAVEERHVEKHDVAELSRSIPSSITPAMKNPSTYKSRFLELNSQHEVHVSYTKDGPKLFAIQLKSDENFLSSIVSQINSESPKSLSEPPMIGSVCLGRFSEDNTLCRAVVMGLTPSQCKLFFVDFGMTESVSHSDIFHIPEEFVTPCVFALRFSLSGIAGLQITEEIKSEFFEIVNNKVLTLRVVPPEGPPLIQYCQLFLDGHSVKDMLLQKQHSIFIKIDPSTITGDHSVLVSYVDSCTKFFIQLSDNIDALNAMMEDVEVHCLSAQPLLFHQVKCGMVCCALFPDDRNWYRASVTNIKKDKITVNYIDYGNDQEVMADSLRPITPELMKMKAQAVHCALKEFEDKPFDQLTSDNLERLTLEKILCMRVQGLLEGGVLLVELLDPARSPPTHIAEAIKQAASSSVSKNPEPAQETIENSPDYQHVKASASGSKKGFKTSHCDRTNNYDNNSDMSFGSKDNDNRSYSQKPRKNDRADFSQGGCSFDKKHDYGQKSVGGQRESNKRNFSHQHRGNPESSTFNSPPSSKPRSLNLYNKAEKTKSPGGVVTQYHRTDRFYKAAIGRKEHDGGRKDYDDGRKEYDGGRKDNDGGRKDYDGGRKEYDVGKKEYDGRRKDYDGGRNEFDRGRKPYLDKSDQGNKYDNNSWNNKTSEKDYSSRSTEYQNYSAKVLVNPVPYETPFIKFTPNIDEIQDVRVSWFINPNDFYVQILSKEDEFKSMMLNIPNLYAGIKSDNSGIAVGASVLARFPEDKVLYRAEVLESKCGGYIVRFIDFGNKCELTINDVWQLERELMELPKLAIHCTLNGVSPIENNWKKKTEIDVYFSSDLYKCTFNSEKGDDVYCVTLTNEDGTDVGYKLFENNLALLIDSELKTKTDKVVSYNAESQKPLSTITVFVTHTDTPGQFWLQLESDTEKIDSLQDNLQKADSFDDYLGHEVGKLCVAKYSADEQFYRTIILDSDNDIITVRFIDYGNTDVLDNTPGILKSLPFELEKIEPYAMKCSVNATPTGTGQWTEQASELFVQLLGNTENPVDAVFILKDTTTYVNLYVNGQSITDKLVEAGHATHAEKSDGNDLPTCFASHVNSPSEFWIQLESSIHELEAISEELVNADEFPPLSEIAEEAICAAKFPEDDLWYRAQVIIHGSDGTEVLFMDYGNASLTNQLRSLPENLKCLPALSRKCALQKPANVKNWSKEAEMKFAELAADGATIFHITFIASGDISIVELFVEGKSITDELVALCDRNVRTPDRLPLIGEDKMSPVCICHSNCPEDFWVTYTSSTDNLITITEALVDAENFKPLTNIEEGAICASMFPEDCLWYRSKVIDHGEGGTEVYHIDFGSTAVTSSLRELPKGLSDLPPIAKHCSLLIPNEKTKINEKFHETFAELAVDDSQEFQMEIIDSNVDPLIVKLFSHGRDIIDLLVEPDESVSIHLETRDNVESISGEHVDNTQLCKELENLDIESEIHLETQDNVKSISGEHVDNTQLCKELEDLDIESEIVLDSETLCFKSNYSAHSIETHFDAVETFDMTVQSNIKFESPDSENKDMHGSNPLYSDAVETFDMSVQSNIKFESPDSENKDMHESNPLYSDAVETFDMSVQSNITFESPDSENKDMHESNPLYSDDPNIQAANHHEVDTGLSVESFCEQVDFVTKDVEIHSETEIERGESDITDRNEQDDIEEIELKVSKTLDEINIKEKREVERLSQDKQENTIEFKSSDIYESSLDETENHKSKDSTEIDDKNVTVENLEPLSFKSNDKSSSPLKILDCLNVSKTTDESS